MIPSKHCGPTSQFGSGLRFSIGGYGKTDLLFDCAGKDQTNFRLRHAYITELRALPLILDTGRRH